MRMIEVVERDEPDWISKPGDSLLVHLRRRGVPAAVVGAALDGGMDQLRGLFDGSAAIDASAATAIAALLGGSRDFWLRRQENFEFALDRVIDNMSDGERDEWLTQVRGPGLPRTDRPSAERRDSELRRRLAFYGVGSMREWKRRYAGVREETAFRTSRAYASHQAPVSLWLRTGELASNLVDTERFNRERLLAAVPEVRHLTRVRQLDRCLPTLRSLLADCGVALVVKLAPDGCRASGAARLVEPGKAMLLLSLRHRSDDHLWFTVLHEIGHLVLHSDSTFVDGEDTPRDEREAEADRFAAEAIVPPERERELLALGSRHRDVTRFAVSIGVSPGLVVGQLQHRGLIGRDKLNFLKRRFDKSEAALAAAV